MKPDKWMTALLAAGLAFCVSLGVAGSIVSAFELTMVSFPALVLTCLAAACYCAAAFSWKRGGILVLLLAALLGGYLWRREEALEQLLQLVYRISYVYNNAYGWGYLQLLDTAWDAGAADLPMGILGAVAAMTVAWGVSRGASLVLPVTAALLPLFSCLVVTDTVPGTGYLFLLFFGLIMLLLTGQVRKSSAAQGNRLTMLAAVPVAAALAVVFLAAPRESYVNRSAELRDNLQIWLRKIPDVVTTSVEDVTMKIQTGEPENVDLAALGSRRESRSPVMYVTAQTGGTVYLRGQDYDVYDGTGWQATAHRAESFSCQGIDLGTVTVKTVDRAAQLYLPYYPAEDMSLVGGRIDNTRLYTEYTFARRGLADGLDPQFSAAAPKAETDWPEYRELPQTARDGAEALVKDIVQDGESATRKAEAIGAFVRNSAVYDRNTSRMPRGEEDFALWFLTESDRGYCVHFATAAVVLLRAAGVEARYVSGYMVRAQAGESVTVTGENAHAWAEYYEPQLGTWLVLEATPASGSQEARPTQETQASQATEATLAEADTPATLAPDSIPEVSTQPSSGQEAPTEGIFQQNGAPNPLAWLGRLLMLLAAGAAMAGQRAVRIRLRRQRQRTGAENAQALARWKEAELLARLLKEPVPEELHSLAQKAKFSQHTLTGEELLAFEGYLRPARKRLRQHPWYRRLVYQYIFAVY